MPAVLFSNLKETSRKAKKKVEKKKKNKDEKIFVLPSTEKQDKGTET